jgi:predicted lipid-binding transport protein (Tim44 family)
MSDGFPVLEIIFFAIVAAFIFLRLRSVLGRRTGHEKPPVDSISARSRARNDDQDKVIELPDRTPRGEEPATVASDGDTVVTLGLDQVKVADPNFSEGEFLEGAGMAYEMIVTSFANGDKDTLRPLLDDAVYREFEVVIDERETAQETVENTLLAIRSTDLIEARIADGTAELTVKFISEMVKLTRAASGEITSGDPRAVQEVTDFWTFARDTRQRDPNWTLIATRSSN